VLSADGRFVVFRSSASNLPGSSPGTGPQLYLLDRSTGALEHVSQSTGGAAALHPPTFTDAELLPGEVSQDGRFVLFQAAAANLVANDTNVQPPAGPGVDVFLRDRLTGTTVTPNRLPDGTTGAFRSANGRMSVDGRWVVFVTSNSHASVDTNGRPDAYLFDRLTGFSVLASTTVSGAPAGEVMTADISDDGRFVAFDAYSSNVVPGDTSPGQDVFVRDMQTGAVERISINSLGVEAEGGAAYARISADGRFVLFLSLAANLAGEPLLGPDLFVRDRWSSSTTLASVRANGSPIDASLTPPYDLSADGRFVLFTSLDSSILPGDVGSKNDVFLRDLLTAQTTLVSVSVSGGFTGAESFAGSLSADGRHAVFSSRASTLTSPSIQNGVEDVFVRSCTWSAPTTYCVTQQNSLGCLPAIGFSGAPSASSGAGFDVNLARAINNRSGLLFYGSQGSTLFPLSGGFACVQPPTRRTALQHSGGSPPPDDCTGAFRFDFNAHVASGVDPALVAGANVWCQYWSRDGASPSGSSLSDALWFSIGP